MAFKEEILIGSKADTRGFKKAETAANKLTKSVKNLAGAFGVVYSTSKLIQFGKASVKAFAEDEKAAISLARTVQNLGLGFEAQGQAVNDYLSKLEKQTGVLDDELRPAMDRFLRSTLDIAKSQELLNLSLDIAAGTGKSVTQVSQSLQKAYLGQTQAIGRLGVGLSKAELTSASFEDIQKRLTYLFDNQAKDAADSYAGQIDKLTIAGNNAKETIGKGLVDALITVSGSGNVDGLVANIETVAEAIADATRELAKFIVGFKYFANPKNILKSGKELEEMFARIDMGNPLRTFNPLNNAVTGYKLDKQRQDEAKKLAELQAKLLKQSLDNQKKLTAEQKKQALLKKAGTIFDLEQIQIIAALKGKLSDEDRKRLELQFALLTGNQEEAQRLTYELAKAQGLGENLAKFLASLPDAKNPFASWEAYLDMLLEKARKLALSDFANQPTVGNGSIARGSSFAAQTPVVQSLVTNATGTNRAGVTAGGDVYVSVQGSVVSSEDLVAAIENGLQVRSLSGSNSTIGRIAGMFS